MRLKSISQISGGIELVTGLHIGAGSDEMRIGGTDNPVVKDPLNGRPYIPGSSIKGKMRSLMEWRAGTVAETNGKPLGFSTLADMGEVHSDERRLAESILKLFGGAPDGTAGGDVDALINSTGPSRLAFWDCPLADDWISRMTERGLPLTEIKMENTINRIGGAALNPRNTERVPAGAKFEFRLTMRVHDDEDLFDEVLQGMRLVELTGLGGSGSRGYGKVRFIDLERDGTSIQVEYDSAQVST